MLIGVSCSLSCTCKREDGLKEFTHFLFASEMTI